MKIGYNLMTHVFQISIQKQSQKNALEERPEVLHMKIAKMLTYLYMKEKK